MLPAFLHATRLQPRRIVTSHRNCVNPCVLSMNRNIQPGEFSRPDRLLEPGRSYPPDSLPDSVQSEGGFSSSLSAVPGKCGVSRKFLHPPVCIKRSATDTQGFLMRLYHQISLFSRCIPISRFRIDHAAIPAMTANPIIAGSPVSSSDTPDIPVRSQLSLSNT